MANFYPVRVDRCQRQSVVPRTQEASMTKQELEAEAAVIFEQEGWLLVRLAREGHSSRVRRFSERYQEWQAKVNAFRQEHPDEWTEPPDNS